MATIATSLPCDCSTLANFKLWAQAISNAFSAFGWTRSSDSGQVNFSTLSTVPTLNGTFAYEIWSMADSLAATVPVYVKIEYGQWIASGQPGLAATVSNRIASTGNVVGTSTINRYLFGPYAGTTATLPAYFSGSTNRFAMTLWGQSFFSVERSHASTGADTSASVNMLHAGYGGYTLSGSTYALAGSQVQLLPGTGTFANSADVSSQFYWLAIPVVPFSSVSKVSVPANASVSVSPVFMPGVVGGDTTPLLGATALSIYDVPDGLAFSYTLLGSAHTYLACGTCTPTANAGFYAAPSNAGMYYSGFAMRYE